MGMRPTTMRPLSGGCGPVTTRYGYYWTRCIWNAYGMTGHDILGFVGAGYQDNIIDVRPRHHQKFLVHANNFMAKGVHISIF